MVLPATDLEETVKPHLIYLTERGSLNPREVKRLINAYTLQMKLLQPRLGEAASADVVLAIQMMAFRPDWARLYEVLVGDPEGFVQELRDVLESDGGPALLGDEGEPVPESFLTYVRSAYGRPLVTEPWLMPYLSSAEQTRSTDTRLLAASQTLRRLRRMFRTVAADGTSEDPSAVLAEISELRANLGTGPMTPDIEDPARLTIELETAAKSLAGDGDTRRAGEKGIALLERIDLALFQMRRHASVGASS